MSERLLHVAMLAALLPASTVCAQERVAPGSGAKQAIAVRVDGDVMRMDGHLDEEVWMRAPAINDFMQKEPTEGSAPAERMEVRFVYDDGALYVGARMFSRDPLTIQAPLGRRDSVDTQSEHFWVSLDTYLDRRTAYTFGVNASGVRLDRYHPGDNEDVSDAAFDPVWEARTTIDELGWTAELWIPFSQLRFSSQSEQVWGLNAGRFTPTLDEADYWVMVPRTERAWSSRFGDLRGIQGIRPSKRIELSPVVGGSSTLNANPDPRNPFDSGQNFGSRVGTDLKMGLGPNLTLDATFNPDFGQVEGDPAEVNLTATPTRFPERRPFFIEGARLVSTQSKFLYSRRIGGAPIGAATGDFVDSPKETTILAAGKITGRLPSRTSVGILGALTGEEFARTASATVPDISKVRIMPPAIYGIARVQQEFGRLGSTASFQIATMHRDLEPGEPLANLMSRNALTYGAETLWRLKGGEYELVWNALGTLVTGEPKGIETILRAPEHYAQRPDKAYAKLDPTRTSFTGSTHTTNFNRVSGRHWLFGLTSVYDTVAFDGNQIGTMMDADGWQPGANITYRETRPGPWFRNYSLRVGQTNEFNHALDRQGGTVDTRLNLTWLNFWTSSVTVSRIYATEDAKLARGGPKVGTPAGWTTIANVGNSASAQTRWTLAGTNSTNDLDGYTRRITGTFSFHPAPRWQLSVAPTYDRTTDPQQYVSTLSGGRPETYGSRYVFAYIERSTMSMEFRMGFTLKPDVNLDVYAEPFAASGRYYDFGEVLAPSSVERIGYAHNAGTTLVIQPNGDWLVTNGGSTFTLKNRDFNVRSFQSNVVLRWEWRPGSSLYVVWQQNRDARETIGTRVGLGDAFRSIKAPGSNIFLVKTSFWMPVS